MENHSVWYIPRVSRKSFRKCSLKLTGAFVVFEGDLTRLASIAQRIIWWPSDGNYATDRKDLSIRCIVVFVVSSEVVGCGGVFFFFVFLFTRLHADDSLKNRKKHHKKKSLRKPPEMIWKDGFYLAAIVKISASFWGFQKLPEKPFRRTLFFCEASEMLHGLHPTFHWLNCHYRVECYFHHNILHQD